MTEEDDKLYDVIFFWDKTAEADPYRQYCSETLCNIMGFSPGLSVKLVYEAEEFKRVLIYSTWNLDKAMEIRNTLIALHMDCKIYPSCVISNHNG